MFLALCAISFAVPSVAQDSWTPAIDLGISVDLCAMTPPGAPAACGTPGGVCVYLDEIVHTNLIPAGPHRGQLFLWTRCDVRDQSQPNYQEYTFWRFDPQTGVTEAIPYPMSGQHGPFCAGHCWMLDPNDPDASGHPRPKLFLFGGRDAPNHLRGDECSPQGSQSGNAQALTWDPIDLEWDSLPELDRLPGHSVVLDGYYYPTVMPAHEDGTGTRYSLLVYGGSLYTGNNPVDCRCDTLPEYGARMKFLPDGAVWDNAPRAGQGYRWHQYPRLYVLSHGGILQAGHAVTCESHPLCPNSMFDPFGGLESGSRLEGGVEGLCGLGFGQSPVNMLQPQGGGAPVPQDPNALPPGAASLVPANDYFQDPDLNPRAYETVNFAGRNVGSWHYCNGALMHTLSDSNFWPPSADVDFRYSDHYDLDRVFVTGGVYKQFPVDPRFPYQGTQLMVEYDSATGAWRRKADPLVPRALGSNLVILPTGQLMIVGGAFDNTDEPDVQHVSNEIFDPSTPSSPGAWRPLAPRYVDPQGRFHPRNYHSTAILLPDGRVACMGGKQIWDPTGRLQDSRDSLEFYSPAYMAPGTTRPDPVLSQQVLFYPRNDWNEFSIQVADAASIAHVCLIGVGSVTHHFDYGQRYVELPIRQSGDDTLQVLPPFSDRLAPPGYYLLYAVNQAGIPSVGQFVLVRYE